MNYSTLLLESYLTEQENEGKKEKNTDKATFEQISKMVPSLIEKMVTGNVEPEKATNDGLFKRVLTFLSQKISKLGFKRSFKPEDFKRISDAFEKDSKLFVKNNDILTYKVKSVYGDNNIDKTELYKVVVSLLEGEENKEEKAKTIVKQISALLNEQGINRLQRYWKAFKQILPLISCFVGGILLIYFGVKGSTGENIFKNFSFSNMISLVKETLENFTETPLSSLMMIIGIVLLGYALYKVIKPLVTKLWNLVKTWYKKIKDKFTKKQ